MPDEKDLELDLPAFVDDTLRRMREEIEHDLFAVMTNNIPEPKPEPLTAEVLLRAQRRMQAELREIQAKTVDRALHGLRARSLIIDDIFPPLQFAGLQVRETLTSTQETNERFFPPSRHRSARIHKKLIKRFGGIYKRKPAMFIVGDTLVIHPALMPELKRHIP
jgi:hypothetical protein